MPERGPYSQGGYVPPAPTATPRPTPAGRFLYEAKIMNPRRAPVILAGQDGAPGDVHHRPVVNTDPPPVRCGMCGGRCRADSTRDGFRARARWICCRSGCAWSSHSPRRIGLLWRLRVAIGR